MSLSTYLLEYGRLVARLRRRRRRAYAPTSNTASHDNHKKILHGFPFLSRDDYGAPLGGPSGRRSSAINSPRNDPRNARVISLEELGTMSKNNLRGITLALGPILDIVPSSSEEATRAMSGQQVEARRNCGNVILYVSI